ncbi:hypothetical protein E2C01_029922 [Portunus trituberculatus]|uniref:Uncharacterized protein n=1 Tax=Portunus trituberculatus TaxID=210409 RepID=A0A5B7EVW2_PORTR|nr:hypothetical protein [Portunus trituberculatus]
MLSFYSSLIHSVPQYVPLHQALILSAHLYQAVKETQGALWQRTCHSLLTPLLMLHLLTFQTLWSQTSFFLLPPFFKKLPSYFQKSQAYTLSWAEEEKSPPWRPSPCILFLLHQVTQTNSTGDQDLLLYGQWFWQHLYFYISTLHRLIVKSMMLVWAAPCGVAGLLFR